MAKRLVKESWQPLSRGFIPHMEYLSGDQIKLYIYLLLSAKAVGKEAGKLSRSAVDMADDLGWDRRKVYKIIGTIDAYISHKLPRNRHGKIEVSILNYKNIGEFYCPTYRSTNVDSKVDSNGPVKRTVTTSKLADTNVLQAPNKDNKDNKDNNIAANAAKGLHQELIELFFNGYKKLKKRKPTLQAKDFKQLSLLLKANNDVTPKSWRQACSACAKDSFHGVNLGLGYVARHYDTLLAISEKNNPVINYYDPVDEIY